MMVLVKDLLSTERFKNKNYTNLLWMKLFKILKNNKLIKEVGVKNVIEIIIVIIKIVLLFL